MPENTAKTATEWVFVAKSMAQLPGSEDQALRLMAHAETQARDVTDWLAVATAWQWDFDDTEKAMRCMSKAESHAKSIMDWMDLAQTWDQVFNDQSAAQQWTEKLETTPIYHWTDIAMTLKNKYKNREQGIHLLMKAEHFASDFKAWMQIAKTWKGSFRNRKNGIRCLENAQSLAFGFRNWMDLSEIWMDGFRDPSNGVSCLEEAEACAENSLEWTELSKIWMDSFQNPTNSIRCLEEAESRAENSNELTQIALAWEEKFQNSKRGIQALENAEVLAKNAWDWSGIGYAWERLFGNEDNSKRCLGIADGNIMSFNNPVVSWIDDTRARRQAFVGSLGFLGQDSRERDLINLVGTWGEECLSERQPGYYARYYSFRLSKAAEVTITLFPSVEATALFLMSGDSTDGEVLDQIGPVKGTAHIKRSLDAGAYNVEAAIKAGPPGEAISFKMKYSIPRINSHRTLYLSDNEIYTVVGIHTEQ